MKKLISVLLLLAMVLGLFAGCGKDKEANAGLASAAEYLTSMYKTSGKDEAILITADQDVLKSVVVDGVSYSVEWTVEVTEGDAESVTVAESAKENHVKLDIPLHSGSDILFTATATISDAEGNTEAVAFNFKVAGVKLAGEGMTMEELVEAAYALDEDQALEGLAVLTGVVTMINTPYDDGYKNLTCTIVVGDLTDMPIKCYRLKGEGAETLAVGDTITVSGTLKNYGGTIEFDAGCMIDELIKSDAPAADSPADPMQIVQDAYALEENASLPYSATLTGTITSVDTPYDAGYQNITVTIVVTGCEDKPIKCYRLKGEGADRLAVGDVITVTGILMNYNGTVEFSQGCTLDAIVSGGDNATVAPADQLKIVDDAYALEPEQSLPYTATLTGVIKTVDTPYDATYQNITVTITVAGREQKPIKCYRLKGTGADTLTVGDTITVSGVIKNYGGTIEFDTGCTLVSVVKGTGTVVTQPATEVEIVDQAYRLQRDQVLPYTATLTGKVSSVKEIYNSQYKNISVVIKVPGRESLPLTCYRMKGTDVDKVAVNDTITVTGTIKNYNGSIQFDTGCTMTKRVSGGGVAVKPETDPLKIVDLAYALGENQEMAYDVSLKGKVTKVKEAYNAEFQNISVFIQVAGRESKPILIYRLKGQDVNKVAVGDTITVVGRLKNFYGDIEMINCTMTGRVSGGGTVINQETDPAKILAAGQKLKDQEELPYTVELTGKVQCIDDVYSEQYQNITVTIAVNGTSSVLKLYRLKGDGVNKIAVGDTLTVKGKIKMFYGELELVNGELTNRVSGGGKPPVPQTDYTKIVDEAYALAEGGQLGYEATLEGRITALNSPFDSNFQNMTVTIEVPGREGKPIECYRMKGDSIGNHLCVGDTIKVTGKIKNYNGTVEFDAGCQMVSRTSCGITKPSDPKQIVDAAFALAENTSLPYFATLTGTVKSIDQAYSDQYKNVTLTITVQGTNGSKDIQCFRMKGDVAASVTVGSTITVTGAIKRFVRDKDGVHEDKIEFDSGCVLESLQKSGSIYVVSAPVVSEMDVSMGAAQARAAETNAAKILTEAYALAEGKSLSYEATLTGKITSIKDPYNSSYQNISVIIEVSGYADKPMLCYRLKGEGADKLAVGDTITVTGTIKNYYGTIEFDANCTLDKVVSGGGVAAVAPEDPKQIVDEAFALAGGTKLPYSAKLTGKIISVDSPYDEGYKNITVTIEVEGTSGKKNIECYRLKGTGAETLKVGDVIVVEGIIQRYIKTDSETGDVTTDKVEFNAPSLIEINPETAAAAYYLVGYINGADHGIGDDSANMGNYKFNDGKITAAFTAESYVVVKTEGNGIWYMTNGWLGNDVTSATLYDSSTLGDQANKLYVPANTVYDFTITENADGSLTLSYAENTGNPGGSGDESDVPTTPAEIVDAAYGLGADESLEGTYTLTGKITAVNTPYDTSFNNITVTIAVEGREDKPIKCYRLTGEGADKLLVDDTITVTGTLTNYKGNSVQFAQGCTLDKVVSGGGTAPVAPTDPKQIVDEAFALPEGGVLPYTATLTGVITEVGKYNETYGDITVKFTVEGKEIECYALKGEGVANLAVGDTITVMGTIKNYYGKVEFDKPTLVTDNNAGDNNQGGGNQGGNNQGDNNQGGNNQSNNNSGKTPAQIVAEAYALKNGESLSYEATLTGKITSVDYAYNATNGDITVTMTVEGKAIKCYRMTGTGVDKLKVGDTITVKGKIKNYNGTVEFDKPVLVSVNTGTTGSNGGTSDKTPGTSDYSMTGLIIIMTMATGALVVLSKKKFYC